MWVTMRYGSEGRRVAFPDANTTVLRMRPAEPIEDPSAAVRAALNKPTAANPLSVLARGKRTAAVVISDITRPVPNRLLLDQILPVLERAGIGRRDILILIATGVHRPNGPDEIVQLVGEKIAQSYRIENHLSGDMSQHTDLGRTSRGTPALIDSRYCDADLRITTALIEPHLMAGYSGGRKAVCPGLASIETMKTMHGPEILEHPSASSGILEGNPFHEEAVEIARMAGTDFIVNVALDERRRLVGVFAGDLEDAHRLGCDFVRDQACVEVEPADIVVTTSAGAPLDASFYQAIKGPVGALDAVKPGGSILLLAECSQGTGSGDFDGLLRRTSALGVFVEELYDPSRFVIDQWQLEELAKASRKATIYCFSDGIAAEALERCFVTPVTSPEDGIEALLDQHGRDARIIAIPEGPYVLPVADTRE